MPPCPPMQRRLRGALALSALLLSACAPAPTRPSIEQARATAAADFDVEADTAADANAGQVEYPDELPPLEYAAPPMANVRELRDGELTCAEIYAETQALERTGREQQAKARQAQEAMTKSQEAMTKQASNMSGGMGAIGGGLLSMVPGGGLVSGLAARAATSARTSAIQQETNRMMQTQMEMINTEQALQYTQARSDHLAGLFLDKGCKLSEVQGAASAQ